MMINKSEVKLILAFSLLSFLLFFESCKNKSDLFKEKIKFSIAEKNNSKYINALKYVNEALKYDSSESFAYVLKGQIESCLEQDLAAIKTYQHAIDLNPKNISAYFFQGLSYYQLDYNDSAINCFTKAINAKKTSAGIIFDEIDNEHLPLKEQINVPNSEIIYFRGLSYFYNNQFALAIDDLMYSSLNGYKIERSQYYLGASYLKIGKRSMACFYWQKAAANFDQDAEKMLTMYCR